MKIKILNIYNSLLFILLFFVTVTIEAQVIPPPPKKVDSTKSVEVKIDTIKRDSIVKLPYSFKPSQKGSLFLNELSKFEVIYDAEKGHYIFAEKIGDYYIKHPIYMTKKEYEEYKLQVDMLSYFKDKVSAIDGKKKNAAEAQKNLLPQYQIKSQFFENIFGGNTIEVNPQGSVLIKMGILFQKVDNPQLSERNRSSTTFDFDQEINASLNAKVGKRLRVSAAFDTQSTFNFQNQIKLEYTPTEDDIIRKIEVGNVSMPIQSSLISGAQNLFGVKTELQFGKTTVTGIFSQQRSQTRSVQAQGGSSINEFDIRASDYDDNRHFFLSQKFRENYNGALSQFPLITSSKYITRIEVWITNKNSTTQDVRNIVALADLGEGNQSKINSSLVTTFDIQDPSNETNSQIDFLTSDGDIRNISTVNDALVGYSQGSDYSILENARKLTLGIDFELNPQLGFITLNRRLADSDILAVAYEYTENRPDDPTNTQNVFRVGELSADGVTAPDNLVVKLLRSEIIDTTIPLWDLMMKNVYGIPGAFQLQQEGFRLEVIYQDDETGVPINFLQNAVTGDGTADQIKDKPLLNLLRLDILDGTNNTLEGGDGYFDFVEGVTINSQNGYIIFPTVEPFGSSSTSPMPLTSGELGQILTNPVDERFIFNELYDLTKAQAQNEFQSKDKYSLRGYFKSESRNGIPLGAFNVPRGSVKVTTGGRELAEGVDYVVDYQIGTVQIIDPNLISSNAPINVSVENNNGFNQQNRTFMGVDVQHIFSDNFAIGGTFVNLNERPFTQKPQFGAEPVNNTIVGFNLNYNTEVPKFTKWVNKLPNIDTDAPSNFSIRAEAAYLLPGSPKGIELNGEAASYVDDFEGSQIPLDISSPRQWFLASVPKDIDLSNGDDLNFIDANVEPGINPRLQSGAERSKLAWYTIDRLFYGSSLKPNNIDDTELSRAEVRRVGFEELFPELELDITQTNIINTLDLAYYPQERGPYNFHEGIDLNTNRYTDDSPQTKWAGIMRSLNTTDFQQANVEYIQFWLMDPYENYSITSEEGGEPTILPSDFGGELYINLGNISEDILDDDRRMYENGMPRDGVKIIDTNIATTVINTDVPINQSLIYAFTEEDNERPNQDIGLDGLTDQEEKERFPEFVNFEDPSNDNYNFFRGGDLETSDASILTRYRNFNNTQGNSPTINNSTESFPTSATSFPDIEDINKDQTMSDVESYYQYKVLLNPSDLDKDRVPTADDPNYIVDEKIAPVNLADGTQKDVKWYQFRIPVTSGKAVGTISGFNSIRFMRMYLTKFKIPVVLRFGELELVRGDWRRYTQSLAEPLPADPELNDDENRNFEVGVVNIEENETKLPIPYDLPPGVRRERLQGSTTIQQQNEQSLLVRVKDLPPGETRAVFKNTSYDMRMFNDIKMYIHAESISGLASTNNNDLTAILRIGSDTNDNFYQLEIPLKITEIGEISRDSLWKNEIDNKLKELGKLRLERFADPSSPPPNEIYPSIASDPDARVRVKGNPNLSNIRTLMIGVRNDATIAKSVELWFNELRVVDFDNEGGWAAVVNADANFADFADVSIAARANSQGFGSLEQRVNERSQEDVKQYDIVTNINLGQLLPKKIGLKIPLNYSISEEFRDPKWDPQYQDVLFEDAKDINPNSQNSRDYTKRRSINLINIRKERTNTEKKSHFYDIENVSVSYAFNETYHRDYNIKRFIDQNVRASATYNHNFKPFNLEPLKNWKFLKKGSYLKFIRDFNINLLPTSISVNSNIIRSYNQQESRPLSDNLQDIPLPELTQRRFMFDWDYNIAYNLTKSLQFNFRAANNYIFDEFNQDPNSDEDVRIFNNFFEIGRINNYHQTLDANYKIPINKIPVFDFVNATYQYTADFDWQAPSQSYILQIGNTIQNANTHSLSADMNMTKFYKKIGLLDLAKKKNRSKKNTKSKNNQATLSNTTKTAQQIRNSNKTSAGQKVAQGFVDVITSVKKIRVAYAENNGTILPGYVPEVGFLGRDNYSGGLAPTLGFVFGSQRDIRELSLANNWLVLNDEFSKTYSNTHFEKLDINAEVKPFKNLDIELSANRVFTRNRSQLIDIDTLGGLNNNFPTNEIGNFSISHFMLKTAFDDDGDATFQTFKDNRIVIAQRLAGEPINPNASVFPTGYGENSSEVLLPAFLAAYSGNDASKIKTSPFRNVPIPNWRVNYKGLMQFDWFKEHFRSFTLEHRYSSTYSVIGYSNNLLYNPATVADPNAPFSNPDLNGNYQSERLFTGINLVEEFSPLIKVDMKMRNAFSLRAEIKKDRALNLNLNNNTITEIRGTEYVLGLGYRIKDVKLKMKTGQVITTFKGDINLKADLGIRENSTVIRSIDINNNQVTGGQRLVSFKFIADYTLNKSLLASFFYDQNSSRFLISTTFPRNSINTGISLRYTIGN